MIQELIDVAQAEMYGCDPEIDAQTRWEAAMTSVLVRLGIEPGGAILSPELVIELGVNLGNIIAEANRISLFGSRADSTKALAAASITILSEALVRES